jgi:cyclin-dependent kinase 8/11
VGLTITGLQQVIHHYSQTLRSHIPQDLLKSLIYQLLNGLQYLHDSHILHRDLKPANILITLTGIVKIGDLGLARLTYQPLQPLFAGDKVVVTIWYRSPELLMGSKHYHKAVDCWAVGCVMAELASLRPIFKGEEAKLDSKKNVPFQKDQLLKVIEVLGKPDGGLLFYACWHISYLCRTGMARDEEYARILQCETIG